MSVVEVLIVIQYNALVVRSGYTRSVMVYMVACSSGPYVLSFRIFGDLENYTFLETLGPNDLKKNNVYIFSKQPMAAILDFQNGDFFLKSSNISASEHHRHMIFWCLNIHFRSQGK